jgi:hypothetical protein
VTVEALDNPKRQPLQAGLGAAGSSTFDWLKPGHPYEFRLYRATDGARAVASVRVRTQGEVREIALDVLTLVVLLAAAPLAIAADVVRRARSARRSARITRQSTTSGS